MKKVVSSSVAFLACLQSLVATDGPAAGHWDICGSFGRVDGEVEALVDGMVATGASYRVETKVVVGKCGVESRRTVLTNVSDKPISARCLLDKWQFDGSELEVYTQACNWQHESRGMWQPLNAGVGARGGGMRSCDGAVPVLAIWDRASGQGRVFHLLTSAQWVLFAECVPAGGEHVSCSIEAGFDPRHLDYRLAPGESVALPEVLSYTFTNKADLDCHKLHAYWNARHPARSFPAVYNSWLCRFDKLDYEFVLRQVSRAKEMGFDYFVVDAGWFGPAKDWSSVRGDWEERPDGYLKGRLADVSEAVREAGMKFGFWLETEAATADSKIFKEHPEWFIREGGDVFRGCKGGDIFLDFRNSDAFAYILETTCALVKKYNASFLKFDFNQTAQYDSTGRNFMDYNAAYRRFVCAVRERNPGIYIEGCASGGWMMDLSWADAFDSFWPTDNQSVYHSFRIVKETMLRLPPRCLERWLTLRRAEGLQPDYHGADSRLLSTDDATWQRVRSMEMPYADAFTAGGPFAMSCDLTAFSAKDVSHIRDIIAARRAEGGFWKNAVGRVLADAPSVTVLQYSNEALSDIRVFVVPNRPIAKAFTVRPVTDVTAEYVVDGKQRSGRDLSERGIAVDIGDDVPKEITIRIP